jgi:hypothetical protein
MSKLWPALVAALIMLACGALASSASAAGPSLTIDSPTSGTRTKEPAPLFSGSSSDTLDAVSLTLFEGSGTAGTALPALASTIPVGGAWSTQSSSLADGTYTAVAEQEDSGTLERGVSPEVTFTVDTTAPAVSLDPVASPTNDTTPTFTGSLGVAAGDTQAVAITVRTSPGGAVARSGSATVSGSTWTYTPSSLGQGTYTVQASQGDSAGNEAATAAAAFTIDTTKPTLTLAQPASPSKNRTPTFTWTAGSAERDLPSVKLKVLNGEDKVVSEGSSANGTWTVGASEALADGAYTARVEQSDEAGNTGTDSKAFTVDNVAPSVGIGSPAEGAHLNSAKPNFTGAAGNLSGDGETVTLNIYQGSGTTGTPEMIAVSRHGGNSWSEAEGPNLADGTYTAQVIQVDAAGNVGEAKHTFTIDTTKPTLTLAQPASPSKNRTPTFTWTAGSAERDLPSVKLKVLNGEDKVVSEGSSANGTWTVGASEALADGAYTARVEQSDEAGNTGTDSKAFTVDNVAPSVGIGSPAEGAHLNSAKPNFTGAAGNLSGDGETVTLNIYQGSGTTGTPEMIAVSRHGGNSWSEAEGPNLADGTYTAQVIQVDAAGNVGEAKHTFTIETNTPRVTLNALPTYTTNATPSFGGGVDTTKGVVESVTLRVFRGGSVAESAELAEAPIVVPASAATWSTGVTKHLPDGTYTAQAEQENLAGTPGFSAHTTFTVDTVAPQPTLSAPAQSTGTEMVSGVAGDAQGDRGQITVELFQGPGVGSAEAFEALTVKTTGSSWSAAFAGLSTGEYTAIARQSDEAGNAGQSAPQIFTVVAPAVNPPAAPVAPSPPVASFTWVPATPAVGQPVSLASNSTGVSSPLSGFGWDVGSGQFAPGGPSMTTSFATPGAHVVRLQVNDANGLTSVATRTITVIAQALKLMQPFPIVRIAGSETASGARVKLLSVQAPATTKVAVTCKGHGCKTKSESRVATASSKSRSKAGAILLSFPRFQRALQAGAVLQIRVSKAGEIGKFTSFTIRRNKLPVRVDACLKPTSSNPSPCPSQ